MYSKRSMPVLFVLMMSLVLVICISFTVAHAAGTVTVANADSIFGEAQDLGDIEIPGFIKGRAYAYQNGNIDLADPYVTQMKKLGFEFNKLDMEDESMSVVIYSFSHGDTKVMLFFDIASSAVIVCYKEGMEYLQQGVVTEEIEDSETVSTVTVANADAIFGQGVEPYDFDAPGYIKGKAVEYQSKSMSQIDTYILEMTKLGFGYIDLATLQDTNPQSTLTVLLFIQGDASVMLAYDIESLTVLICYQEGTEYKQQTALEEQLSGLQLPIFSTTSSTQAPLGSLPSFATVAPSPSNTTSSWEASPGYITLKVDGVDRILYQSKSEKSYIDKGDSILMYTFYFEGYNEWGDVDMMLNFSIWSKAISGDTFSNKTDGANVLHYDNLKVWTYHAIEYYDRFSTYYVAGVEPTGVVASWRNYPDEEAAYSIKVDNVSKDRFDFAGTLSAVTLNSKGASVQLDNGHFQVKLHSTKDEVYDWMKKE